MNLWKTPSYLCTFEELFVASTNLPVRPRVLWVLRANVLASHHRNPCSNLFPIQLFTQRFVSFLQRCSCLTVLYSGDRACWYRYHVTCTNLLHQNMVYLLSLFIVIMKKILFQGAIFCLLFWTWRLSDTARAAHVVCCRVRKVFEVSSVDYDSAAHFRQSHLRATQRRD